MPAASLLLRSQTASWAAAALFAAALVPALLFNGVRVEFFALYHILLFLGLALFAAQWRLAGARIPNTAISLSLVLLWTWLGVSLLWHPVPQVGFNYFWIVGTLPLAFLIYTAAVDQDALWRRTAPAIFITGLALALWAIYQWGLVGEAPRSVFLDINSHAAFLNLIALPASAYFLLQPADQRWHLRLLGAVLFVLFFAIALPLIGSLGASAMDAGGTAGWAAPLLLLSGLAVVV
ncbi:MAG: hypothetical protein ACLGGU_07100, partial [Gammaproteobacteria bacterium]